MQCWNSPLQAAWFGVSLILVCVYFFPPKIVVFFAVRRGLLAHGKIFCTCKCFRFLTGDPRSKMVHTVITGCVAIAMRTLFDMNILPYNYYS